MRVAALRIAAAACAAVGLAAGAGAAVNAWTSTGPAGAKIASVAVSPSNPQVIYVGTTTRGNRADVYRTTNAGVSWTLVASRTDYSSGAPRAPVPVAVDPASSDVAYASLQSGQLSRTADGGATWTALTGPLTLGTVHRILVSPSNSDVILIATNAGVKRSIDGGLSWNPLGNLPFQVDTPILEADPGQPSRLYAVQDKVYRSTDGGATWASISGGLPPGFHASSLGIDPTDSQKLYLGTSDQGLFRTTDGGANWSTSDADVGSLDVVSLAVDPIVPATVYAGTAKGGLFSSADSGDTWQPVSGLCMTTVSWISTEAGAHTHLRAAGFGGFFESANSGADWTAYNAGLRSADATAVLVDPTNHLTVYAATYGGGVFESADEGATWPDPCGNIGNTNVLALAMAPSDHMTLYAGTDSGVFQSTDGGASWAPAGLSGDTVTAIAVDPTNGSIAYAGTKPDQNGDVLFETTNGGASWSPKDGGLPSTHTVLALAIDPTNSSNILAGLELPDCCSSGGFFRSTDGGAQWSSPQVFYESVSDLWIDPNDAGHVLAASGYGLQESFDLGQTWSGSSPYLGAKTYAVTANGADSTERYAGSGDQVASNKTGNSSWGFAPASPLPGVEVHRLAIDPVDPARVYAALLDGGVASIDQVAPEIDSLDPASGSTAGDDVVTIHGSNFMPGAIVAIGGVPLLASHYDIVDSTSITLTTPAHVQGFVDVSMTNPTQLSGALSNAYQYVCSAPFTAIVYGDTAICAYPYSSASVFVSLSGVPPWTLHWSDGTTTTAYNPASSRYVEPLQTTTYALTSVTDSSGCDPGEISGSATITVHPLPDTPAVTVPPTVPYDATDVVASVVDHEGSIYSWSVYGAFLANYTDSSSILFTPWSPGQTITIQVQEQDANGCVSSEATTLVQTDFVDAPPSYIFHDDIDAIAERGVTQGCGSGNFCPDELTTRAQMAIFLLRGEYGGNYYVPISASGTVFADVPADSFAADFIEQLAREGITQGCGGGNYCPNDPVTRAQMAIFLLRVEHGADYVPPPATGTVFEDVPADAFAAAYIEQLSSEGITRGCDATHYCPNDAVTRGQMAAFLRRTFGL